MYTDAAQVDSLHTEPPEHVTTSTSHLFVWSPKRFCLTIRLKRRKGYSDELGVGTPAATGPTARTVELAIARETGRSTIKRVAFAPAASRFSSLRLAATAGRALGHFLLKSLREKARH